MKIGRWTFELTRGSGSIAPLSGAYISFNPNDCPENETQRVDANLNDLYHLKHLAEHAIRRIERDEERVYIQNGTRYS